MIRFLYGVTFTSFIGLDDVCIPLLRALTWHEFFRDGSGWYSIIPMGFHSCFYACCVGQASNPGPDGASVKFAVVNPTTVHGKIDRLLDLGADCLAVSETSATSVVQKECTHKLRGFGFRCFWSKVVAPKKSTNDNRPSYRGEALGSAIFCSLTSRQMRGDMQPTLWETQRFSACIARFGQIEVLVIAVYGFANRHKEGIRPNDRLIANLIPVVMSVGLPFIIAGDFNEPLVKLPAYNFFQDLGAIEAFQWYRTKFQCDLPATCSGSTRNDTAFMHPVLADHIAGMSVCSDHQFDIHSPLLIQFDFQKEKIPVSIWNTPKTWATFAPTKQLIEEHYMPVDFETIFLDASAPDVGQVEHAFQIWSQQTEKAVDEALQTQNRLDPLRFPQTCLPSSHKGRCVPEKIRLPQPRQSVKTDRHGGFTPPCEVFHLKTKLKVRQVRRIKTLIRRFKSLPAGTSDDPVIADSLRDASLEWKKILNAKGYGSSWSRWILSFDAVSELPTWLPDMEFLSTVELITEHDCVHACRAENKFRTDQFRGMLQIDQSDDFCKTTYKILKAKNTDSLSEVPVTWNLHATLLRSSVGHTALKIDDVRQIPMHAKLFFGQAQIELVKQENKKIFFRHIDGILPARGILQVKFFAVKPDEIADEFRDFWSPMWLRDVREEQFSDRTWNSFCEILDSVAMPAIPEIQYPIDDVNAWMDIIRRLPSGKAVGPCGWSNDEIKALPRVCIADLIVIFKHVFRMGFGPGMMMAKTVLLSKVPTPQSMHRARPITILSCLYRLLGKFVFRVTAQAWKDVFPYDISGGLPGRGVKELAFTQKRVIEQALGNGTSMGGFSLDLIKAYNTFGRWACGRIMQRLGIPEALVSAWIASLDRLVRYPTIQGCVAHGIPSTTGVPEGCSISVLAMLATSCFYYHLILRESVRPFAYADNWSWMSTNQKAHFLAYQQMLRGTAALRLQIDHEKSWHWGTKKEFRDFCLTFECLHPQGDVKVQVKNSVKDLGEVVSYSKGGVSLGFIKDKIDEAVTRLHRLEWIPASLQTKAKMIQSAIWPLALYSSDTTYIGKHHYTSLRRAAVNCLVGKWHNSSSVIGCTFLSKFLIDPLLHTMMQCARIIRRIASVMPDLAKQTIKDAVSWTGSRPFGPATAFRQYVRKIGWHLEEDGTISGPDFMAFNVLTDSCKRISRMMRTMWHQHLLTLCDRKGIGDFFPDVTSFHRVFHGFDDLQQNLLKLNVVGGFQTQSQKAKWDDETKEACELCNADDTREHRLLHCPALKDVRDVMVEQCNVLENCRQEWIYLPIPRKHPDASLLRAFFQTVKFPETIVFRQSDCERWKIFTDGSAKFPRHAPARIATWSLCRTFQMALARENRFWIFCFCLNRSFLYSMCVGWESFLVTNPLHVLSFLQF